MGIKWTGLFQPVHFIFLNKFFLFRNLYFSSSLKKNSLIHLMCNSDNFNMEIVQHLKEKSSITKHMIHDVKERLTYGDIAIINENTTVCESEINAENVDDFIEVWMKIKRSIEE